MSFLNHAQLEKLGLCSFGSDILISDKASFHGASRISLGDSVRIDDFCVLSAGEGGITIGNHVHVACFSSLIGRESITLGDFSGISSRVSIYSSSDDYSGEAMTNPTVPEEFTRVDNRPVFVGRHCIIGAGSVILPGVKIGDGAAIGALSLINKDCTPFTVYSGVPARRVSERLPELLEAEKRFIASKNRE